MFIENRNIIDLFSLLFFYIATTNRFELFHYFYQKCYIDKFLLENVLKNALENTL